MAYTEVLSPAEERFEKWRKGVGLFLGPTAFVVVWFIPMDVPAEVHRLTAVLAFVLTYWLTEAIPIPATAVLGAVLNVAFGVAPAKDVFSPFAHPLVFLFIGSFMLAEAITCHRLDKRFAYAIFSLRFMQRGPLRVLLAIGCISAVVSMWISNTASTAMMLPIALGVLGAMKEMEGAGAFRFRRFSTAMMLMVAYGASVGGIATPIGTPPNLIGIGMIDELLGLRITFFEWMVFALPITAVMFVFLFFILGPARTFGRLDMGGIGAYVREARGKLGRWTRGQANTAFAFSVAVFLWVLPSLAGIILGKGSAVAGFLDERLNEGAVAVFAASLLFILPVSFRDREFTISWDRAVRIDWGTILLFGGGLSLGSLMFSTGLAEHLGEFLTGFTGVGSVWGLTAMGTALAIVLSETTSNTASANMVIPVVIATAQGMGVSPLPPALGACLGASFGFMLPVSTPPNAIVYGSGRVPILAMLRNGVVFDIGGFFIIMGGLLVLCPLMGWV